MGLDPYNPPPPPRRSLGWVRALCLVPCAVTGLVALSDEVAEEGILDSGLRALAI